MRFLVDQCLSPDFAEVLAEAGHDVVHLRDLGMQRANDREVLDFARSQDRTLVSADTDFGTLLAQSAARRPSVVIFRRTTGRRTTAQAGLLLANLPVISEALDEGSVVVLEEARLRVRRLPIIEEQARELSLAPLFPAILPPLLKRPRVGDAPRRRCPHHPGDWLGPTWTRRALLTSACRKN